MENKQYPLNDPEQPSEALAPLPEVAAPAEDTPVIEELTFQAPAEIVEEAPVLEEIPVSPAYPVEEEAFVIAEAPVPEEVPAEEPEVIPEEVPSDVPEEITMEENLPEEASTEEASDPSVPEEAPAEPRPDFMERIPEVEDAPAPEEAPIAAIDIMNDPEFAMRQPPQENAEDVNDQEYSDAKPAPERENPYADRLTRKGRPKRKKGQGLFGIPHILVTLVWLALIVAIGVTLGRMLWICAADVLAFGREDKNVTITIYEADTMEDIVDKLHDGGLIRYKSLFNLYASISDAEEDIKPGIYDLNTRYDYHALVNFMSPGSTRSVVEITIPEGYTCQQIFALLEENRVCTALDIGSYAMNGALSDYWFLEGVERENAYSLEGFLFPDTYQFYKNSTPREALEKMLDNFNNRFSEEMRAQLDTLNAEVTNGEFGIREVVIVASLIEKESAAPAESPSIAGVIYNRLYNWDYPALLNIDAAIIYAQGGESDTIDTSIDSPYNTYRNTGLTPTPIANPGLSSLQAALDPASHNYYYYVLNPATGMHQFSTTQEEHNAYIDQFYN